MGTLVAAGAADWEPAALQAFTGQGQVRLVKRCLDLADLLATAATGTAQVAVVSDQLPGLDADSVDRLRRDGVRTIAVTSATDGARRGQEDQLAARGRLLRIGVARVVDADTLPTLAQHVLDAAVQQLRAEPASGRAGLEVSDEPAELLAVLPGEAVDGPDPAGRPVGRLVAVWGPTGAPGRTTLAVGLGAEAANRGSRVTLVDADPYGGAVGQHLAVLDEVSGLLAAARLANAGQLDHVRLAGLAREVAPGFRIVTGLPRPDRWTEVRPQALSEVLTAARLLDQHVVVDTGFGLPSTPLDPFAAAPTRDEITLTVLEEADEVAVVGAADPVGLTRLVRSLRDLAEIRPSGPHLVVVNRMRSSLGWSTREIGDLVAQVAPGAGLFFLPEDRVAADRAMVSGRTLLETGDSPLRRAVARVAEAVVGEPAEVKRSAAGTSRRP